MAPNNRNKLTKQEVLSILRDRILFLELEPGAPISDVDLARELEVSRTPIREALLLLQQEHLVDIYPQSGTFVSPIDLELIREVVFMRHVLECEVLMHMVKKPQPINKDIQHTMNLQELAIREGNQKTYVKYDHQFHKHLFSIGGHARTWELIRTQYIHTTRFHMLDFKHSNLVFNSSFNEHQEILTCLENGDRENLQPILNIHHDCDLRTADSLKQIYPEYFL